MQRASISAGTSVGDRSPTEVVHRCQGGIDLLVQLQVKALRKPGRIKAPWIARCSLLTH